jgi:hypothetical protein
MLGACGSETPIRRGGDSRCGIAVEIGRRVLIDSFRWAGNNEVVSTGQDSGREGDEGTGRARRLDHASKAAPLALGGLTLAGVALLLTEDAAPRLFPAGSHAALAAFSLAAIAIAYLIFQCARRDVSIGAGGIVKAVLLAAAFLFWAANQFWPNLPQAGLFNDVAIGLFVLDVFLVMTGRPAEAGDGVFGESCGCSAQRCEACGCGGGRKTPRT